ncbi:MAG: ABC transporter ATP-binding protein [Bacteroidales bacterium]
MNANIAISVQNLTKSFARAKKQASIEAVRPLSFDVQRGELFGLIGPDGAGKTTLFRMLTTLILPDSGSASVDGFDIVRDYKEIRQRVGYMPGRFSLYQDLTVEENLLFFATLFNTTVEENYEFIKDIYSQIEPFKTRKAGKLSGGMKQKLALSCALIHKPSVLFLDEPTTGVDPVSRKEFWEMLKKLKAGGMTIMASTPYMDEAVLCDRIALMQDGKLLDSNTPAQITEAYPWTLWAVYASDMFRLLIDLRKYPLTAACYSFGEFHHLSLKEEGDKEDLRRYLQNLQHANIEIHSITPNIEDCFMQFGKEGIS